MYSNTINESSVRLAKNCEVLDGKGYWMVCSNDSPDPASYITNAIRPCVDDSGLYKDDDEAALAAKRDGVLMICGMAGIPDDIYVDTDENRNIIKEWLAQYPWYVEALCEEFPEFSESIRSGKPW